MSFSGELGELGELRKIERQQTRKRGREVEQFPIPYSQTTKNKGQRTNNNSQSCPSIPVMG
ncbi:MAG: hypothetical protein F6J96_22275 [Symploca sp. SIO1C2]|nr:hypothetical protein [Symploca sp. SIO1C2]